MTVTLEDLVEDPWEVEYNIRVFLNLLQDEKKTLQDHLEQEKHVDEDELAGSMDRNCTSIDFVVTATGPTESAGKQKQSKDGRHDGCHCE